MNQSENDTMLDQIDHLNSLEYIEISKERKNLKKSHYTLKKVKISEV